MMAALDRCEYCDYCRETGSDFAGVRPGQNGKVTRRSTGELLCDRCDPVSQVRKTQVSLYDGLVYNEDTLDEDDETEAALSSVQVREDTSFE